CTGSHYRTTSTGSAPRRHRTTIPTTTRELLGPELDVAPDDGDRTRSAGGAVRAELVVEAAARAGHGELQRAVDVHAQLAADHVDGVDLDADADHRGTRGGDRATVVDRVQPAAALD